MKKKLSFLLKVICLISIVISILVFAFIITNLEETKVKLYSSGKVNLKSESQGEVIKASRPELKKIKIEDDTKKTEENLEFFEETIEIEKDENEFEKSIEIELNNENCEYSINENTNTIQIDEYNVLGDCIVIPNEIDGKKVENINTEDFSNNTNLETIKVPKEIATKIEEIPNFEIDESLEEENYIIYTTTREYGEAYRNYLELTDEEKKEIDFIPPKYEIPLEIRENVSLESVGNIANDSAYDLRDDIIIKVEDQNPYGICYTYAALSAAETYWSLNHNETIDFSEVHASVLSSGSGGNYLHTNEYFSSGLGPLYEEDFPVYEVRCGIFPNSSRFDSALRDEEITDYLDVQSIAKEKKATKYITSIKEFPTILIDYKNDYRYDAAIEEARNNLKNHIKTYGAIATMTNADYAYEYNGKIVQRDISSDSPNHAVTIIGWDDNFDISNFPSSSRPSKNGAYLVLNSWGNGWGDDGCYWISYEDKWIEYWLVGVTGMVETGTNLQASSIVVTDQETGNVLDNANIEEGTKIKIQLEATITNEIAGENIKVKLRDNLDDYSSYLTVLGTEFVNKKANIEILLDTAKIKGNQYILEISYGDETISKMIETPLDYCYIVNDDGTITLKQYLGKEKEVIVPAEYEGYKVFTVGENAFYGTGVTKITVEEGITTLGDYALANCSTLEEIYLPRTLTTIGTAVFFNLPNVEEIIIPRSVKTIGMGIVQRCTNLKRLVIFKETTSIGTYMFYETPNAVIYCENNSPALTFARNNSYRYSIITESYNITYNSNAESDTVSNMPATQNKVKYDTITMSSNVPVRTGYKFLGWALSASQTEVDYLPGDSYRTDANLNLYAIWESQKKELNYTVEYYKDNVKQNGDTEITKIMVMEDDPDTITVDKSKINTENKYEGYEFVKTEPSVIPDTVNSGTVIKVYYNLKNYNITYSLNGGSLASGKTNPSTYTIKTEVTLNNPEKEGHTFTGWTGSNGNTPQKTVKIEKGSTGDKNYNANYNVNTYTVTYKVDGQIYGEVETYEYGQTIVPRANPAKEGYKFSGWSDIPETMPAQNIEINGTFLIDESKTKELIYKIEYYKDNVKQDLDTITEKATVQILDPDTITVDKTKINTENKYEGYSFEKTEPEVIPDTVTSETTIKVYYVIEEYNITYDLGGGVLENGKTNPNTYTIKDSITLSNPEKEGYTFIGWTGSNGEEPQKTVKIENDTGDKNYKANYTVNTYKLTIKYNHPKGNEYPKEYVEEYQYGKSYSITSPVIPGYTANPKIVYGKMGAENKEFEVNYTANTDTKYTVEYYKENIENNNYTLAETEICEGTTDTSTAAIIKDYEGFTNEAFEQQNISGDGNTSVKIYYTRNQYSLIYKLNGEQYGETETYRYEQRIVPKDDIQRHGYIFSGWSGIPEIMPAQNIEVIGTLTLDTTNVKELNYTVEYYKDGQKQEADTEIEKVSVQVLESDTIAVNKEKINIKDKYLGYKFQKTEPAEIPNSINSGEIIKVYYTIESYNISYELNGGTLSNGKVNPESYTIKDRITLNRPQKEGYTFTGWTGSNGNELQKTVTIIEETGDKNYVANYSINTYKITYIVDGRVYGDIERYEYGQRVVPRDIPAKEGYKFSGWSDIPETMPAQNIEITGTFTIDETQLKELSYTVEYYKDGEKQENDTEIEKVSVQVLKPDTITVNKEKINIKDKYLGYKFQKIEPAEIPNVVNNGDIIKVYYNIETYNIIYDLDGGQLEEGKTNPNNYTVNDTFTLNNPEREGYTFIGWTESNGEDPKETIRIEKGTTGNKEYKANYSVNSYTVTYKVDGQIYGETETYKYGQRLVPRNVPEKEGYKFVGWSDIPEIMPAQNIEIIGSFVIDETKLKELKYTVEYYKNNVKQDSDTQVNKIVVQVLQSDTITVDKTKINTKDKYVGYKFQKTEPAEIPDVVNSGENIKVYYEANTDTKYIVEHYKQNIENDEYILAETEECEGITDSITEVISKEYAGFTSKDFKQQNIKGDESTVIKIYYDRNTYKVTYKLDGEIEKVETYKFEEPIIQRENLEKYGYKFSGWTDVPETMPAHNLEVLGYFEIDVSQTKEISYTIEYYKKNVRQDADTFTEKRTVHVLEADQIKIDKTKINTENKYEGLVFEKIEPAEVPDFVANGTVIKIYYSLEKYNISYDLDGGKILTGINPVRYTKEDEMTLKNPEKEGYTFIGWTGSNGEEPQKTVTIEKGTTGNKKYKANYTLNTYTIEYDLDGGNLAEGKTNPESYTINDVFTLKNPEKEGYVFIGWTGSNGNVPEEIVNINKSTGDKNFVANYKVKTYRLVITYMHNNSDKYPIQHIEELEFGKTYNVVSPIIPGYTADLAVVTGTIKDEDVYIKVQYTANTDTKYVVEHYKQNIENDDYTFAEKEECVGTTDTNTEAIAKEYFGFAEKEIKQQNIKGDETTVVKIYYDRNKYTITYKVDGKIESVDTYKFEEPLKIRENLEKYGYKFSGWSELPEIMPAENLEVIGSFIIDESQTKELKYSIEYYKNNVKQEMDTEEEKITVQVLQPDTITVDKTKINTKDKYDGYKFEKTEPAEIFENVDNGTVIKVYYVPENYLIEYDLAGGEILNGDNPNSYTVEDEITLINPEKEGYTFVGWTGSNGEIPEVVVKIQKGTTGNKVYKANYTVNTYTLTYKVDGEQYGEIENYEYGQTIIPKGEPTKRGYKFSGWSELPETMPARNVEIEGSFFIDEEQIKEVKYTIEYYKNNIKQEKDTIVESMRVFVFEDYELVLDKTKVNTKDKYVGYSFEKTEPQEIPEILNDGDVIKIYYTANEDTKYVVEHYKQNIENNEYTLVETEECLGTTDTTTIATAKEYKGFFSKEFTQENIAGDGTTKVKIYYDRKEAKLNIEFRDFITGEEISEKVIKTAKVYDSYDLSEEPTEIDGYTLIESPNELSGEYTEEEQTKVYKYAKNSKVIVNYIDMISNENIIDSIIIDGYETKDYKTEEKEFENYIFVKSEGNLQGKMTKEDIIVNYFYKKEKLITTEEYLINDDNIKKITMGTTISDFAEKMNIKGKYTILDQEGNVVSDNEIIKTGMKLKLEDGKEYDLIVRGDINCDGNVSLVDLSKILLHYNGMKGFILEGCPCKAADMNFDDNVSLIDISQMIVFYNSI